MVEDFRERVVAVLTAPFVGAATLADATRSASATPTDGDPHTLGTTPFRQCISCAKPARSYADAGS